MAVLKYYRKLLELTSQGYQTYTPKRGEKTEAFNYTGQTGYRKFTKAIIRKPNPKADLKFRVDMSRPKGTRFTATDKNTGREYYNIPARYFQEKHMDTPFKVHALEALGGVEIDGMEFDSEDDAIEYIEDSFRGMLQRVDKETVLRLYYEWVLQEHAERAQFFLIGAGESYMWGAGGGRASIAEKLQEIFKTYSETNFNANDKNSSYYGNWFTGVTAFTTRFDILPQMGEAIRKRREYREKFKMHPTRNYRKLKNGLLGVFENGRLIETIVMTWDRS